MPSRSLPPFHLGYFGRAGSFSHLAAQRRFPKARLSECPTVEECFSCLHAGVFSHILVPIENASSGTITNTADQLMRLARTEDGAKLQIREALAMRIELVLMARPGARIEKVYSHPAPFDHGRAWLDKHYPQAERIPVSSTSEAAILASREKGAAAIAGLQALKDNKLKIVSRDIGKDVANQTTFIVIGAPLAKSVKPTHTSLVFELPHKPGSLVAVLQALSRRKLNLTKILSRPIPGRFEEYRFMIEFLGAAPKKEFTEAMACLKKLTDFLAVIGSYPVRKI